MWGDTLVLEHSGDGAVIEDDDEDDEEGDDEG